MVHTDSHKKGKWSLKSPALWQFVEKKERKRNAVELLGYQVAHCCPWVQRH